jgi:hypothetical protein
MLLSGFAGLALAVSALTFSAAPAFAIETQAAAAPAASSTLTFASERCSVWVHRCRGLYPAVGWRFRRCMTLHACG